MKGLAGTVIARQGRNARGTTSSTVVSCGGRSPSGCTALELATEVAEAGARCFFLSCLSYFLWLWFVLSYMTQQDGLAGRQDGRMVGIQVRIMIPLLPSCSGMALLLHVRWFVLTFAPFFNNRNLDVCMYHPALVSPHPGKHVLSVLQAAASAISTAKYA